MKKCPVPGCMAEIDDRHVACLPHWETISAPLRKTLWLLWKEGTPLPGFEEALASAIDQLKERSARHRDYDYRRDRDQREERSSRQGERREPKIIRKTPRTLIR